MPSWRKLELMAEMGQTVRTLALSELRQRYPNDTPSIWIICAAWRRHWM
jgi:hypothetical protein